MIRYITDKKINKPLYIASLVFFSIWFVAAWIGIIRKLLDNSVSVYIPKNLAIAAFSLFWIVKDIYALRGKVKRIIKIPGTLFFDIAALLMFLFEIVFFLYGSVVQCLEGKYGTAVFLIFFLVLGIWGFYVWFREARKHFTAYYYQLFANLKSRKRLVKQVCNSFFTCIVADISLDIHFPYIDDDGHIAMVDSSETANKFIAKLGFRGSDVVYKAMKIEDNRQKEFFQHCYDMGFSTIYYVTPFCQIPLEIREFGISEYEDPIHQLNEELLRVFHAARQREARYKHLLELGKNKNKCRAALETAAQYREEVLAQFKQSLFYVFVIDVDENADSDILISENAYDICENKRMLEQFCFDGNRKNLKRYLGEELIPYTMDDNREKHNYLSAFSLYSKAIETKEAYAKEVGKIIGMIQSANWQGLSEIDKICALCYKAYAQDVAACNIGVMTGKELADYAIRKSCRSITLNNKMFLTEDMLHDFR